MGSAQSTSAPASPKAAATQRSPRASSAAATKVFPGGGSELQTSGGLQSNSSSGARSPNSIVPLSAQPDPVGGPAVAAATGAGAVTSAAVPLKERSDRAPVSPSATAARAPDAVQQQSQLQQQQQQQQSVQASHSSKDASDAQTEQPAVASSAPSPAALPPQSAVQPSPGPGPAATNPSALHQIDTSRSSDANPSTSIGSASLSQSQKRSGTFSPSGHSAASAVVDWPMALEQCSGDEEFLRELLVDLWTESADHLEELMLSVPSHQVSVTQTVAHTMKGAAANLMCYGLRDAALAIEKLAFEGSKGGRKDDALHAGLQQRLEVLQAEMAKFEAYLQKKDLI